MKDIEDIIKEEDGYENYPVSRVGIAISYEVLTDFLMGYLYWTFHPYLLIPFIVSILYFNIQLMKEGCSACYYYGKVCPSGKGFLVPLLFKKRPIEKFLNKEFCMKDFAFILIVSNGCILLAIVGLIFNGFRIHVLIAIILMFLSNSVGQQVLRGNVMCSKCKLRSRCPAMKFFGGKKKDE